MTVLENGDRVAVLGGGPAGSFFAYQLLREATHLQRRIEVVIIERRRRFDAKTPGSLVRGCNHCAGGISPRLYQILEHEGIIIPEEVIHGHVDFVWVHGQWKNFRLRVPPHLRMCSVFRGSLPPRQGGDQAGFDEFLLREAVSAGALVLHGEARSMEHAGPDRLRVIVRTPSGEDTMIEAGFVTVATGISTRRGRDDCDGSLMGSISRLNPAFVPGKSRRALIFEFNAGEDYLRRYMHREVHYIEYGARHLDLEHAALIPKGPFLTVVMIGECVDQAVLPQDGPKIMHSFLVWPEIQRILPGIDGAAVACVCYPNMTVTPARSPVGDRFALVGDAVGSRLYKDGLYSAHATASRLARAVLLEGTDRRTLKRGYGRTIKDLAMDNRYGRVVFRASHLAFSQPVISRIVYQSFATELKRRGERYRPLGTVLWKIASGTAEYREVLREMASCRTIGSILVGAAVTLRNVTVEALLGLRWREAGRYPTVVPREEFPAAKLALAPRWVAEPGPSHDFERIYRIKIRGSEDEILQQLAQFGRHGAQFLNLRFVRIRRIEGDPNGVGTVIRYQVPLVGLETDMRLIRTFGRGTLLYQLDERLADRGRLVFNIAPTPDGNNQLTIYAAFNYKRGRSPAGPLLAKAARALLPMFIHDVVWNHALCTIKEAIEFGPGGAKVPDPGEVAAAGRTPPVVESGQPPQCCGLVDEAEAKPETRERELPAEPHH